MVVSPTSIDGVLLIQPIIIQDLRGEFSNIWSLEMFRQYGIEERFDYSCLSANRKLGTMRGLHFQEGDSAEAKLVRCERGEIFDVAVDLRPESPSYLKSAHAILSESNRNAFYIPKGCAHGFQTLMDDSVVSYLIAGRYMPESARTVAWYDTSFNIPWPETKKRILSAKDEAAPRLKDLHGNH